jgi:hypothetical protein
MKKDAAAVSKQQRHDNRAQYAGVLKTIKSKMQVYQPTKRQLDTFRKPAVGTWSEDGFNKKLLSRLKTAVSKARSS